MFFLSSIKINSKGWNGDTREGQKEEQKNCNSYAAKEKEQTQIFKLPPIKSLNPIILRTENSEKKLMGPPLPRYQTK